MRQESKKICLVSSSGGHFEQLKMLKSLEDNHEVFWVTEKTNISEKSDYYLIQTGLNDKHFLINMIKNFYQSLRIWYKERPDYVITTGTAITLPLAILAKLNKSKLIYIETFARVYDGTKTGQIMYKISDLFIVQWKPLKRIYPKSVYGGSIY